MIKQQKRPGDIEVDFMMGKSHKGALLVITDRATLNTKLHKLKTETAIQLVKP